MRTVVSRSFRPSVFVAVALAALVVALARLAGPGPVFAQAKKTDKKETPKVANCSPITVKPGTTAKVNVRGFKLDAATEVKFADGKTTAKIAKKDKVTVPQNQPPEKWGDTQINLEIVVPADVAAGLLSFVVVTPTGETAPQSLLVGSALPLIKEIEPNPGFRKAQTIAVPQAIDGAIGEALDVDVFAFSGKAGKKVVFEVWAARVGSLLDPRVSIYDEAGRELATADDTVESADCRLEFSPPRDGTYFVAVSDAHEAGGGMYAYRLTAAPAK